MVKSLFILSSAGEILIEKHWRGVARRDVAERFWATVCKHRSKRDVPPIITTPMYYLIHVQRGGMFYLACVTIEVSPLVVVELLHRIVDVFETYFTKVTEQTMQANFATVYQLLEEMVDNGYPLITEPNTLMTMIKPPSVGARMKAVITGRSTSVSDRMAAGAMSVIPWRAEAAMHKKNEIFFDVVEEVDCIQDSNGQFVFADVVGVMCCNSRLSGMPECLLSFNDVSTLTDLAFHPCVRINRFEKDRVLSFVPPDGVFEMMKYKVKTRHPMVPMYCKPVLTFHDGVGNIDVTVGGKPFVAGRGGISSGGSSGPSVEEVVVIVTFPAGVAGADVSATVGTVTFPLEEQKKNVTCFWHVGAIPVDGKLCQLSGKVTLVSGITRPEAGLTASVKFTVPGVSISNLKIARMEVTNERYPLRKAMRSLVKAGRFQVRA